MNTISRYMMALCLFTSLLGEPIHAAQKNSWNWRQYISQALKYSAAPKIGLALGIAGSACFGVWYGLTFLSKKYSDYQLRLKDERAQQLAKARRIRNNNLLNQLASPDGLVANVTLEEFIQKHLEYLAWLSNEGPILPQIFPDQQVMSSASRISWWTGMMALNQSRLFPRLKNIEELPGILTIISQYTQQFTAQHFTTTKKGLYEKIGLDITATWQEFEDQIYADLVSPIVYEATVNPTQESSEKLLKDLKQTLMEDKEKNGSEWLDLWNMYEQWDTRTEPIAKIGEVLSKLIHYIFIQALDPSKKKAKAELHALSQTVVKRDLRSKIDPRIYEKMLPFLQ